MTARDPADRAVAQAPGRPDPGDRTIAFLRRAATGGAPLALAVGFVAHRAIAGVLGKLGHPGAPLDDAYIHFQYARAIAEGHPMRFQADEPMTSGATSLLWPLALAPFWLAGARGNAILWPAWGLSFAALGGLAREAARLTERLAGRAAAVGAGAMIVVFGGLAWSAASGMEVVPFAWILARAARRAAEWAEAKPEERSPGRLAELIALAWGASLMRPEGAVTALFVGATIALFANRPSAHGRAWALAAVAGVAVPPLLLLVSTGAVRSNTALVKLLPGNPYFTGAALAGAILSNVQLLLGTLLNGEIWSAEFLPRGGAPVALAGLLSLAWLGNRTRSRWRAVGVLLIAVTMAAPCLYVTFLWNRLRYLWPFASGWLVGLACLARVVGDVAASVRPRWRVATPMLCGVFVGCFASKLDWVLEDVAQSASGIDRQQVALGRWAKTTLPSGARIGVNDTGAIAYFGDRRTFDVVGLTTEGEARYWLAGPASRLEHYERLRAESPARLPTHFIVYPEWMAMDTVLGEPLYEATVTDATILGGKTMRAYVADWSALGSGEQPWTPYTGAIVDQVDVADLESEEAHAYEMLGARDGEQIALESTAPGGAVVVDGGRTHRIIDRFVARLHQGVAARGIARLHGSGETRVQVLAGGTPVGAFDDIGDDEWVERTFDIPAGMATERTPIELRVSGGAMATFHYWFTE